MSVEDSHKSGFGSTSLFRFRCVGCMYGVSDPAAPERCPICGGSAWEFEDWRPFSSLLTDMDRKQSAKRHD
jgi:rubrerythrin